MSSLALPEIEKIWKPHKKQVDFIRIPDSIGEVLYGGAAGGGKSDVLIMLPIIRGWHEISGFQGMIFRRTFPQLEESIIKKSKEYYPLTGGRYNAQNHVWNWITPDGGTATMRFSYLDNNDSCQDHDSAEFNYLGFDELTAFTRYMYFYLFHRVRSSNKLLPAIVRSTATPGNIGHAWVRDRFVKPFPSGRRILVERMNLKTRDGIKKIVRKRIFIPAKLWDNPHITQNDPDYINKISMLGETDRKAKLDGDWWVFQGQVFTEFREMRLPDDPPNALHVIPPIEIPTWWPKILAIDWGFAAQTYALWAALSPDGRVFIYREYHKKKATIVEWSADISRLSQYDTNIVLTVMDPSAWKNIGEPKSIAQQFMEISGLRLEQAYNDRLSGKMLIHEYLRFNQKPAKYIPKDGFQFEIYQKVTRLHGEHAADEYRNSFVPDPPEINLPKAQIFNTCPELVKALQIATYRESKKDGLTPEDIKEFDGDDPIDDFRYLLKAVERYEHQVKKETERLEKTGRIIDDLSKTQDMTAFYRRMELLDHEQRKANQPIVRSSGGSARSLSGIRFNPRGRIGR